MADGMSLFHRLLLRLAIHVNLGPLNPWILGIALGRVPRRVQSVDDEAD